MSENLRETYIQMQIFACISVDFLMKLLWVGGWFSLVNIGSSYVRHQAIACANADLVHWRIGYMRHQAPMS